MRYNHFILILLCLVFSSISVLANQNFTDAYDVYENALPDMRIFNLTNISESKWINLSSENGSNLIFINSSLKEVLKINNPERWAWHNKTLYELYPRLTPKDEYFLSIEFEGLNISKRNFLGYIHKVDDFPDCTNVIVRLILNENKLKLDYNIDEITRDLKFVPEHYTLESPEIIKIHYDSYNQLYEYKSAKHLTGRLCLNPIDSTYPDELYTINFTVYSIIEKNQSNYTNLGVQGYQKNRTVTVLEQKVCWNQLINRTHEYNATKEENFLKVMQFNDCNIAFTIERKTFFRFLFILGIIIAAFGFSLLIFFTKDKNREDFFGENKMNIIKYGSIPIAFYGAGITVAFYGDWMHLRYFGSGIYFWALFVALPLYAAWILFKNFINNLLNETKVVLSKWKETQNKILKILNKNKK